MGTSTASARVSAFAAAYAPLLVSVNFASLFYILIICRTLISKFLSMGGWEQIATSLPS